MILIFRTLLPEGWFTVCLKFAKTSLCSQCKGEIFTFN